MSQPVEREGSFKAEIKEFGLKVMESGAVAIAIKALLTDIWDGIGWSPWGEYQMEAEGDFWVIKKDGQVNKGAAESLIRHASWDGNLESVANETWQPTPCQVTVKREEYEGKSRFKISFVNELDRVPGGLSNVSVDKARELQTRFGGQLRAIAGNSKRNGTPASGAPAAPPRPSQPPKPPQPDPVGVGDPAKDFPFGANEADIPY